jgi:hypothetical protein
LHQGDGGVRRRFLNLRRQISAADHRIVIKIAAVASDVNYELIALKTS